MLPRISTGLPCLAGRRALGRFLLAVILCGTAPATAAPPWMYYTQHAAPSEKESRTPAQRKINSQLLYELYRSRGEARQKNVPPGPTGVTLDRTGRALVDVRAEVTPALEKSVRMLGGAIESTSREYRSLIAWVPLKRLERLAADPAVRAIEPAAQASIKR